MTLGERLNTYLNQLDQKQSAVATDWLERYKKQNPKARWEPETIISHLNRCLKEKREGVKFFFEQDALRTDLLFEVLRVPQAEHAELRRLARECLDKEGEVNCRLVIDATTWGQTKEQAEALFDAVKQAVLHSAEKLKLTPVALIITEQQYEGLPRSYDKLGDWLRIEQVKDDKEGWSKAEKLAGDGALVVSSRRYQPIERWLAMEDTGKKTLVLEPQQGLDFFAAQSRLPAPPSKVAHPLQQVAAIDSNTKAPIPSRPSELRRLLLALADEEQVLSLKFSAAERLALAQALSVPAISTERERVEYELAGLVKQVGVEPKKTTSDELAQVLARAQRREVPFSFFRVGDELHALNPGSENTLPKSPRLKVHRYASRTPALNRLLGVIDSWTEDDYAADRGLMRTIERLDPNGQERNAFLHARASILWSNGLCSRSPPTPLSDWKAGLGKLLSGEPPAAQLRLFVEPKAWPAGHLAPFVAAKDDLGHLFPSAKPLIKINSRDQSLQLLSTVPLPAAALLSRQQKACIFDFYQRSTEWNSKEVKFSIHAKVISSQAGLQDYYYSQSSDRPLEQIWETTSVLIPRNWKAIRQRDLWLDLHDCSPALAGASYDQTAASRVAKELQSQTVSLLASMDIKQSDVRIPGRLWPKSDQDLGLCWLAMKQALLQGDAVRLHSGIVLLSLGAGFFARIDIRRCATVDETSQDEQVVRAALDAFVCLRKQRTDQGQVDVWKVRIERCSVTTHRAKTTGYKDVRAITTLGYRLPKLYLAGHGLRAEVSFVCSPLFLSAGSAASPVAGLAAAGAQTLAAAQQEDQRQADDAAYDDDDD